MNAEILAVGTELLMGQISNTNAMVISQRLNSIGINVYFHSVVGDNVSRLRDAINLAFNRSDLIILTGGLGPTQDDITKETVSEFLGRKLILHQESLDRIKEFFVKIGKQMSQNNVKQAYLPEGCIVIENNNGTAPGCIIEKDNKIVIMFPGPPFEMQPMLDNNVIPYLCTKVDDVIVSKYIKIFGMGESHVEEKVADLIKNGINPTVAPYLKQGEVMLRVTSKSSSECECERLMIPVIKEISHRLGDIIYSYNNEELKEVVAKLLVDSNITFSLAESCTGGLIASQFTDIPGISKVFNRSIVCYSNESKIYDLRVDKHTINIFGAVSEEVAIQMAQGIRDKSKTQIGIAVTGIAGPDGGSEQKPVGLVYIALSYDKGNIVNKLNLSGNRNSIRNLTCLYVFDMIRRWVNGQY